VNSSAITARHLEVPNLIWVGIICLAIQHPDQEVRSLIRNCGIFPVQCLDAMSPEYETNNQVTDLLELAEDRRGRSPEPDFI
jgi:hypothetical protein